MTAPNLPTAEDLDAEERRPLVTSAATVEAALIEAASAARRELSPAPPTNGRTVPTHTPRLPSPPWATLRRAYHSLADDVRRATLVRLLLDEADCLETDRGASWTQRVRTAKATLDTGAAPHHPHGPSEREEP